MDIERYILRNKYDVVSDKVKRYIDDNGNEAYKYIFKIEKAADHEDVKDDFYEALILYLIDELQYMDSQRDDLLLAMEACIEYLRKNE